MAEVSLWAAASHMVRRVHVMSSSATGPTVAVQSYLVGVRIRVRVRVRVRVRDRVRIRVRVRVRDRVRVSRT